WYRSQRLRWGRSAAAASEARHRASQDLVLPHSQRPWPSPLTSLGSLPQSTSFAHRATGIIEDVPCCMLVTWPLARCARTWFDARHALGHRVHLFCLGRYCPLARPSAHETATCQAGGHVVRALDTLWVDDRFSMDRGRHCRLAGSSTWVYLNRIRAHSRRTCWRCCLRSPGDGCDCHPAMAQPKTNWPL